MVVPPWRHPSYVVDAIKALSTLVGVEELALYLMIEEDDIATIEATTPKKPIQYNPKELREKYVGAVAIHPPAQRKFHKLFTTPVPRIHLSRSRLPPLRAR